MRIIVMGAGPIGGIIGGRLARAGNDVTLVDVNPDQVRAIRERGLTVVVPDGPFRVDLPIVFPQEIEEKFDLAFIAVRPQNTLEALASLKPHLHQGATLILLQNGIHPPHLEELAGPDHAICTVIRMASRLIEPGHVETRERGHLTVGHRHGGTTPQLASARALLDTVIPTDTTGNIMGLLWSKLTYNSLLTFGALADLSLKTIWQSERNRYLSVDFMAELTGVGAAAGARFEALKEYDPSDYLPRRSREERFAAFTDMALHWKNDEVSSSANRLKRGMKTEVDTTVGQAVKAGEETGVPTPVCRALVRLIREIEDGKRPLQGENYDDLAKAVSSS